ncbi:hypothetical protein FNH22_11885 [Fulvivirga sp. M361]|uniref:hypothetical protein n=1 Tax=Fulvivirga sp. M361 TaxID=2594266 RepID=UPI00117AFFB7|nr:hypothetical protein [Fulvivirga sp. M361]TRX59216.1 hypothetical protein FNH22_11885 [Fulvivirga sp. M361]
MDESRGLSSHIKIEFKRALTDRCVEVLVKGYQSMISANQYSLSWEEEQFSAHLISHMEHLNEVNQYRMDIIPEPRLYDEEVVEGKKSPKKSPKADIRICMWSNNTWSTPVKFVYIIEAKNLSERDWKKESDSKVIAKAQKKRYIETGIDHFISGHYPEGCLAGYVVQGDPDKIVLDINEILRQKSPSRESEILGDKESVYSYPNCYRSKHSNGALRHFLLKL